MKAKVPLYRTNPTRAVLIDTEATRGAVVGVNLFNEDGSLYVPPSAGAAAPGTGIALDDVQVLGPQSVAVTGSIAEGAVTLALAGDADTPGNTYLYSTGLTGAKGWNALSGMLHQSANVAVTFGADGTATFDLKPLTDSGAGTFKLITRDSYGRLAGTKAGTTSDVPEGTNLYFTAARAAPDPGYINGLQMAWVSATQVTVSSGAAYIQSAGSILQVPATITVTFSGLAASTWYHLYLYNNAGNAAIEYSTMAPASPYNGTARAKTGDTSRRYVGSVLADASANVINFVIDTLGEWRWLLPNNSAPLRCLSNGMATVQTDINLSPAMPVTATHAILQLSNSDTSYFVNLGVSMAPAMIGVAPGGSLAGTLITFPTDSMQTITYYFTSAPSAGFYCDVVGFGYSR